MLPGEQLVEHHAGAVDVAGRLHTPALRLLRRHVGDGADQIAVAGERVGAHQMGDTEVHHLDVAVLVQHDVLRLHVAVHDPLSVRAGDRVQKLDAQGDHVRVTQPVAQFVQRLAAHQLPHQHAAGAVREPVVEGDDVGVLERRGGLDLPHDPRGQGPPVGDDLERHRLVLHTIVGLEHLGGGPAADPADQLVAVAPICVVWGGIVCCDGHLLLALTSGLPRYSVWYNPFPVRARGRVAELADALGSGSSELTLVGVQVPPRPPSTGETGGLQGGFLRRRDPARTHRR